MAEARSRRRLSVLPCAFATLSVTRSVNSIDPAKSRFMAVNIRQRADKLGASAPDEIVDSTGKIYLQCSAMLHIIAANEKTFDSRRPAGRSQLYFVFTRLFRRQRTKRTQRPGKKGRLDLTVRWNDHEWLAPVQPGQYPLGLVS